MELKCNKCGNIIKKGTGSSAFFGPGTILECGECGTSFTIQSALQISVAQIAEEAERIKKLSMECAEEFNDILSSKGMTVIQESLAIAFFTASWIKLCPKSEEMLDQYMHNLKNIFEDLKVQQD